jgi:glycosyltransferase involved in cell wall biosynthesis
MKVLWFTNSPSLYAEVHAPNDLGGGWMSSLESVFRMNSIELAIAFHAADNAYDRVLYKGNTYYQLPKYKNDNVIIRTVRKWLSCIENEKFATNLYLQVIEEYKPDIIHVFGTENAYGLVIAHTQVPVIVHIQGLLTVYYHKFFSGFSPAAIRRSAGMADWIKREMPFYGWKQYEKRARREQKILSHCKAFFGRTDWDRRITRLFAPGSLYFHCEEMLRDDFYEAAWEKKHQGDFEIMSVFTDNVYKGLETIYDCAHLLVKSGFRFRWKIAGLDSRCASMKIISKNRHYPLQSLPVELLGSLSAPELVDTYMSSDLAVHPSHIENSSNGICEAQMLGIPLLCTAAGGTPSLVRDTITGYLIQDGDPWAMAGAILEIYNDYESAVSVGKEARKAALKRHDKDSIFSMVISVYKQLLNQV